MHHLMRSHLLKLLWSLSCPQPSSAALNRPRPPSAARTRPQQPSAALSHPPPQNPLSFVASNCCCTGKRHGVGVLRCATGDTRLWVGQWQQGKASGAALVQLRGGDLLLSEGWSDQSQGRAHGNADGAAVQWLHVEVRPRKDTEENERGFTAILGPAFSREAHGPLHACPCVSPCGFSFAGLNSFQPKAELYRPPPLRLLLCECRLPSRAPPCTCCSPAIILADGVS